MLQAVINEDSLMRRRLRSKPHRRPSSVAIVAGTSSSHRSIANYSSRMAICAHSTSFDAPLGGALRNINMTVFGMEKLEWFGYPMVKTN